MEQIAASTTAGTRIAILADDLIWASRLRAAAVRAGADVMMAKSSADIDAPFALIDLGGRGYDGLAAVRAVAAAGAVVLAVTQHDDVELRKAALGAGARRVLSYNKMFSDGPAIVAKLIEGTL